MAAHEIAFLLAGLLLFGAAGGGSMWLVKQGWRSGDQPADPHSNARVVSWNEEAGRALCRVDVRNSDDQAALIAIDARWTLAAAVLFRGVHARRHTTARDRRQIDRLSDRQIGIVPAGGEQHWDLPVAWRTCRTAGAIRVVVTVSGHGDRVLRHVHRLTLRDVAQVGRLI